MILGRDGRKHARHCAYAYGLLWRPSTTASMFFGMDTRTREKRSEIMAAVRSKDTTPELAVRHLIFALGYRYRLHDKRLPGTPDLAFPSRKKAIFIHGCFWHGHEGCSRLFGA
jgi:DNA mismatch endonuclease Vsr